MNIPEYMHGTVSNILADESFRAAFLSRPSVMLGLRPALDGNAWCVLYGANIQEEVYGFGDSPDAAMAAFDKEWYAKRGIERTSSASRTRSE